MLTEDRLSEVLSEFARTLVTDFPIQGILDHLVRRIVDILPIDAAGVSLISPTTHPQFIAGSDESAVRYEHLQTALGEGPCLAAYETEGPISIPDLAADDRFPRFTERALARGAHGGVHVPAAQRGPAASAPSTSTARRRAASTPATWRRRRPWPTWRRRTCSTRRRGRRRPSSSRR